MPSKQWGTPLTVKQYIVVGENEEIPKGEYAYVFNQQAGTANVWTQDWEALINGDLTSVKNKIETEISHSKVQWIRIYWDSAVFTQLHQVSFYVVSGFKIEAIVKNEGGASLTGAEIVLIIIAVAFLALVIAGLVMAGWVIWRIMAAAEALGPVATIGVGVGILVILLLFLFLIFGGKAEYRGKRRRVRLGK